MAAKLIHYHSSTSLATPSAANMQVGQIAINHADKKLFILDGSGNVVVVAASNFGTVASVNSQLPNGSGAVTLTPANLGATTVGTSVFTAANTAGAQLAIGASSIGSTIFTAASAAAVLTAIGAVPTAQIGVANGIVPLGADTKISIAYLPDSILGSLNYQGTYNATTNTPALPNAATGNKGWYYVTSVAGTYTPPVGSPVVLGVGDWIVSNGTTWDRVEGQNDVTSVAGRTGAVVLTAADIASGTFIASVLGANSGNNLVLTTNGSGASTWVSTVPSANLPLATTSVAGAMIVGAGLAVTAGTVSVDTASLTLNEGTF